MSQKKHEENLEEDLFPTFTVELDDEDKTDIIPKEEDKEEDKETFEYAEDADDQAIGTFKTLIGKGILEEGEDKFNGTWEQLEERMSELPQQIATSIVEGMPEPARNLIDFAMSKGDDLTLEDIKTFVKLEDEDFKSSNLEINNLEQARNFMSKKLKDQGLGEDAINAALDAMEDKGEEGFISKAKEQADKLKTSKAADLARQTKLDKEQREIDNREYENLIMTQLKELNYTDEKSSQILSNLNSNTIRTKNELIRKSPKALIKLADFYSHFDTKTGDFNLESYIKSRDSKGVENYKKNIMKDNFNSSGARSTSKKIENNGTDELVPILH